MKRRPASPVLRSVFALSLFALSILISSVGSGLPSGQAVYVSPIGAGDGSSRGAPANLLKGIEAMRVLIAQSSSGGVFTLHFLPGVYEAVSPILLGAADSPKQPVAAGSYVKWEGEGSVILSGGTQVPNAQPYGSGFFSRPVPGMPGGQPDAIWDLNGNRINPHRSAAFVFNSDPVASSGACPAAIPPGARLVVQNAWTQTKLVVAKAGGSGTSCFTSADFPYAVRSFLPAVFRDPQQKAFYEGFFEQSMDAGHFWRDNNGSIISRVSGGIIAPRLTQIMRITDAHDITITGIQFQHNTRDNSGSFLGYQGDFLSDATSSGIF